MKRFKKIFHLLKNNLSETPFFHLNFEFNSSPYFAQLDWLMINYHLNSITSVYSIEIHALVLMNTHCHILFKSNEKKENYFCEELFKKLNIPNTSSTNLVEPIYNFSHYLNTYKYIYRNPVEAGLSTHCEKYPFSSLKSLIGQSRDYCQIIDPLSIIQNPLPILKWLNNQSSNHFFQSRSDSIN